jgi:hypothetical protein
VISSTLSASSHQYGTSYRLDPVDTIDIRADIERELATQGASCKLAFILDRRLCPYLDQQVEWIVESAQVMCKASGVAGAVQEDMAYQFTISGSSLLPVEDHTDALRGNHIPVEALPDQDGDNRSVLLTATSGRYDRSC